MVEVGFPVVASTFAPSVVVVAAFAVSAGAVTGAGVVATVAGSAAVTSGAFATSVVAGVVVVAASVACCGAGSVTTDELDVVAGVEAVE